MLVEITAGTIDKRFFVAGRKTYQGLYSIIILWLVSDFLEEKFRKF